MQARSVQPVPKETIDKVSKDLHSLLFPDITVLDKLLELAYKNGERKEESVHPYFMRPKRIYNYSFDTEEYKVAILATFTPTNLAGDMSAVGLEITMTKPGSEQKPTVIKASMTYIERFAQLSSWTWEITNRPAAELLR